MCTFSNQKKLEQHLSFIVNNVKVWDNRILVLQSISNCNLYYLIYNTPTKIQNLRDTIVVHRHKSTNTLYTINCVNWLVNKKISVNAQNEKVVKWQNYKNCFMVVKDDKLTVIELKLKDIIKLK